MAVTQTNTLNPIELVKNPIPVQLSTDNMITQAGTVSYKSIFFSAIDTGAGKTLIITWPLGIVLFTTAQYPNDSGTEIPRGDDYATKEDWVAAMVPYILKNETIFQTYNVWSSAHVLLFEAINKGVDYDISSGISGTLAFTNYQQSIPNNEVRNLNFKLILSVYIFEETRGGFTAGGQYDYYIKSKTYELEPLNDSSASFLIEEALQSYFLNDVLPSFNLTSLVKTTDLLIKYYYRYSEKYGEPAVQRSTNQSNVLYALNGGINQLDFKTKSFYNDIIRGSTSKFLNWHPLTKNSTKEQHDFLYFVITKLETLYIRYTKTSVSGVVSFLDILIQSPQLYDVLIVPVSFNYLSTIFNSNDIVSFNVKIIKPLSFPNISLYSEIRYFRIIETPLLAKYYIFKNSLGVYESIMFTGERIKGVVVDKLSAKRIINYSDAITTNENVTASASFNISSKVYTGFKTKAELNHFIEFLKSDSVYEQTDTYYKPVLVNTKKVTLYKDQEFINSASVVIIDPTENNYSNA